MITSFFMGILKDRDNLLHKLLRIDVSTHHLKKKMYECWMIYLINHLRIGVNSAYIFQGMDAYILEVWRVWEKCNCCY